MEFSGEGVGTTLSTFYEDTTVYEVDYCTYVEQRREVSSRTKISSGDGYWKPIGKEREIVACGRTVGIRRTLAFHETNKSSCKLNKTRWCMTEYCLAGFASTKVHTPLVLDYNEKERL